MANKMFDNGKEFRGLSEDILGLLKDKNASVYESIAALGASYTALCTITMDKETCLKLTEESIRDGYERYGNALRREMSENEKRNKE